jgi:lipoprotein-anchoring transpeptidase ErfK/SrfK
MTEIRGRLHPTRRAAALIVLLAAAAIAPATAVPAAFAHAPAQRAPLNGGTAAPAVLPPLRDPVSARAVQIRLVALRYLPANAVSGRWDYRTAQAVIAFQAWEGLDRDGTVGARTLAALATARPPQPTRLTTAPSIEVYRAKGVTLLVADGHTIRAIHSSSGRAGYVTPAGRFRVFRKELSSWSYPYGVWLPYASYFNGGIAFHASPDVPAYPASHGCIRVSAPEASYLYAFARLGTPVTVY